MNRKHILAIVAAIAVAGAVGFSATQCSNSDQASSPTTSTVIAPTPTSTTTKTVTQSPTPMSTTTVTPPSTVTLTVTPEPPACIQNDMSTKGWNDHPDNTSEGSDSRPGIMALGNATGVYYQSGDCFDTMSVKTDTDEAVGFDVRYVDKSEVTHIGSGHPVEVQGEAFLKFTVLAHIQEGTSQPSVFEDMVFSGHGAKFPAIVDVQTLGYLEGRLVFVVGLSDRYPFAATREANPDQEGTVAVTLHVAHH